MTYLDPDLIADETANAEAILAALADLIPGWQASEGHVETAQAEAIGIISATIASLITDREREDYAAFGENVLGLERDAAGVASCTAEIDLTATAGGTVPAGFTFAVTGLDGVAYGFATIADATGAAGATLTVTATALEAGPEPNGATGAAVDWDTLDIVDTVTVTVAAAGGSEEEDLEDYVVRVVDRARRLRALPITPDDHAALALDIDWVDRALAVNRSDPANPGDQPGHVAIYPVTSTGEYGSAPQVAELEAYYAATDLVMGAEVHVAERGDVDVTIAGTVKAADGFTTSDAETAAEDAILAAFTYATWNLDEDSPARWTAAKTSLTVFDVAAVIDDLPEIDEVTTITINGGTAAVPVPATSLLRATSATITAS